MEHIAKKINITDFITRYPLTYPGIKDSVPSYVTYDSIRSEQNANYGSIPLGLNEEICGSYSNFTKEMGEIYGGQVIYYSTLRRWLEEFRRYYRCIYSNECGEPFSSVTEYYIAKYGQYLPNYSTYEQMDIDFKEHGGDLFYKWLINNYFISLDLKNEYYAASSEIDGFSLSFSEWVKILNNIHTDIMYYPDVVEFYGKMYALREKYGDNPNPADFDNCCECLEYINLGASAMCSVLRNWINKVEPVIESINTNVQNNANDLMPSFTLQIPLQRKLEDFGNFVSFCKEFVAGERYVSGNVCTYNEVSYIHTGGNDKPGYKTDDNGNYIFDTSAWSGYTTYYMNEHPEEFNSFDSGYEISGRTVSSLDSFLRTEETVDGIGNTMPGYYRAYSGSTFIQPAEDTFLDIKYEIGKAVINEKLKDNLFFGDVLLSANVFYSDVSGNPIAATVMAVNEGDNIFDKISASESALTTTDNTDGILRIDFIYYKGTEFSYNSNGYVVLSTLQNNDNGYVCGVKCVDHCQMEVKSCSYYLSAEESYSVKYYNIIKDVEERYSDDFDVYVDVAMCDCTFNPGLYKENGLVVTPAIRKEELLGFSLPETIENNIYLDRGYATVLDRHLRLGEVSSYEALSKYGNGSFNLIKLEEESV